MADGRAGLAIAKTVRVIALYAVGKAKYILNSFHYFHKYHVFDSLDGQCNILQLTACDLQSCSQPAYDCSVIRSHRTDICHCRAIKIIQPWRFNQSAIYNSPIPIDITAIIDNTALACLFVCPNNQSKP